MRSRCGASSQGLFSRRRRWCFSRRHRRRALKTEFVCKPQRGGGNNLYGDELKESLTKFSPQKAASPHGPHPASVKNGDARPRRRVIVGACVCELGIYGTILTNGEGATIFQNTPGHLLRQKSLGVDEGGVAAGFACLSSPALV